MSSRRRCRRNRHRQAVRGWEKSAPVFHENPLIFPKSLQFARAAGASGVVGLRAVAQGRTRRQRSDTRRRRLGGRAQEKSHAEGAEDAESPAQRVGAADNSREERGRA